VHVYPFIVPTLVGTLLGGLLLGYASESGSVWRSAVGLIAVLLLVKYLPALLAGNLFSGSWGLVAMPLQMLAESVTAILGVWLGQRGKGYAAVA
jgi:hypothetical protein